MESSSGDHETFFQAINAPPALRKHFQRPPATSKTVVVHPDNWLAYQTMSCMDTQWRTGFNGFTGLDYGALPIVEARIGVKRKQRSDLFHRLRVMENEMLGVWAERREKDRKKNSKQ